MLQKKQKSFAEADRAFSINYQNNFKNMVIKIDINVLKIQGLISLSRRNEAAN